MGFLFFRKKILGAKTTYIIPADLKEIERKIRTFYSSVDANIILDAIKPERLRVILSQSWLGIADYFSLARVERMSKDDLDECYDSGRYGLLESHKLDYAVLTEHWVETEKYFMVMKLKDEYGREPTEMEFNIALADELLSTGRSPPKECRAFALLKHPDWFESSPFRV